MREKITNRPINNEEYENQKRRLKVNLAAIPCNLYGNGHISQVWNTTSSNKVNDSNSTQIRRKGIQKNRRSTQENIPQPHPIHHRKSRKGIKNPSNRKIH